MRRGTKLYATVLFFSISFVAIYHVQTQTAMQRYSGMFLVFIKMIQNGYVQPDFFSGIPLDGAVPQLTSSLPQRYQAVAGSNWRYPSLTAFYILLVRLLNITPKILMLVPVGVLSISLLMYALSRRLLYDNVLASLFTIYYILYILIRPASQRLYVGTMAIPLYLISLVCVYRFMSEYNTRRWVLIFLIIAIALPNMWHTKTMQTTILITAITGIAAIVSLLTKSPDRDPLHSNFSLLGIISIINIIISVMLVRIYDREYVLGLLSGSSGNPIKQFIENLLMKIAGGPATPVPYEYNYQDEFFGAMYFNFKLLVMAIAGSLVVVVSGYFIYSRLVKRVEFTSRERIAGTFVFAAIFAQITIGVLYSGTGVGLMYVSVEFILFGISALLAISPKLPVLIQKRLPSSLMSKHRLTSIVLCVLIVSSLVFVGSMAKTDDFGKNSITTVGDAKTGSEWIREHHTSNQAILLDFSIFSKYLYYEVQEQQPRSQTNRLNPEEYAMEVGDKKVSEKWHGDLFTVDVQTMESGLPVHSYSGRAVMNPRLSSIRSNRHVNKIFTDNRISVYQFR